MINVNNGEHGGEKGGHRFVLCPLHLQLPPLDYLSVSCQVKFIQEGRN